MIKLVFLVLQLFIAKQSYAACSDAFGNCDPSYGLCWDTSQGRHFCTCKAGFTQVASYCLDVDECKENICGDNAQCVNTYGSYKCFCNCGYVKDYTQTRCLDASKIEGRCYYPTKCTLPFQDENNNIAFNKNYQNSNYKTFEDYDMLNPADSSFWEAKNKINSKPTCTCEEGHTHDDCGFCVDIDECTVADKNGRILHDCDPNAKCMNTKGSYYCQCHPGYFIGPCGKVCYRSRNNVPESCDQDLSGLLTLAPGDRKTQKAFNAKATFLEPVAIKNYKTCPRTDHGKTTTEKFDLDGDGSTDLTLNWLCTNNQGLVESNLQSFSTRQARWGEWTCWSDCKATCWGGVRTRSRRCWYGRPGQEGCEGSGSEKKECYTGTKCPLKIRKDIATLTVTEEKDLMQAMEKYKKDMSSTGFHNAAGSHGWPSQCYGNNGRESCCPHGAKMKFLTWHRSIILNYEAGLSRYLKDKSLGVPYWNWLRDGYGMPPLGWDKTLHGYVENPFTNCTVFIDRTGPMRTIQRSTTYFARALDDARSSYESSVVDLMKQQTMHAFSEALESVHNSPHVTACGNGGFSQRCLVSLGQLGFAGFDGLFMFHHSQVDRLSAIFEDKMQNDGWTWTPQNVLESFEPLSDFSKPFLPFSNETMNPFPLVRNTANMEDFFYYRELMGFEYDCLNAKRCTGARTLDGIGNIRPPGLAKLLIAQYTRSIPANLYINFFDNWSGLACDELTRDLNVGRMLVLGVPNQREFKNAIPTTVTYATGFNFNDDVPVTACYTQDATCFAQCKDTVPQSLINFLPSPALVQQVQDTPVDIFKFNWQENERMPSWPIYMVAGYQWVYFYGDRAANIRQVETRKEFTTCDATKGREITCSNGCILRPGRYYLIDNTASNCNAGLKLEINSRQ